MTTTLHVLRVFADEQARFGNPLGVFLDGAAVPVEHRQQVAARLGFSETVFVDDVDTGTVEIYTPASELPFAGHPLVGTAWLLAELDHPVDVLHPKAGAVPTWRDPDHEGSPDSVIVWIRGRAEWAPGMSLVEHSNPADIDALDARANSEPFVDHWAWIDENAGIVRSRVFAPEVGITEDEATGGAAVRLVTALGRPIRIIQGQGSDLFAQPGPEGSAEVGGRAVLVDTRDDAGR
jgi:predicted PhzF superfamily epimerase YddE/YHI9